MCTWEEAPGRAWWLRWDVTAATEPPGVSGVGTSGQARGLSEGVRQQGRDDGQVGTKPCQVSPRCSVRGMGQKSSGEEWSRERGRIHSTELSRKKGTTFSVRLKHFKWKSWRMR